MSISKSHSQLLITCLMVALSWAPTLAETQCFPRSQIDAIDQYIQDHFSEANWGISIGLIDESGQGTLNAGRLGRGREREIDGDTLFEIGSISKTFTTLLLLDMPLSGVRD